MFRFLRGAQASSRRFNPALRIPAQAPRLLSCSVSRLSYRQGNIDIFRKITRTVITMPSPTADPAFCQELEVKDIEEALRTWPSPETRDALNETIQLMTEDVLYVSEAKKRNIDKALWQKILPVFRRQVVTSPRAVYKTNKALSDLMRAIEASVDTSSNKGLGLLKGELFKGILVIAADKFAPDIALVKAMLSASDLRVPHEWYPEARLRKRRFIYHGGPTNSGKTYQALQRLRSADPAKGGGLYCGPLRLLALEVYENLTRQGIYCDLLTGQEKRSLPESSHVSCTVELVSVTREFDVAVVDEIQMIGNPQRGHSWTRALQGLLANEIHICGGLESSDRVRSIVEEMGDSFEIVKYDRLSPLVVADESLQGDYSKIRKGDCIVAFSRNDLYSIKAEIERLTPHKCCMVYGQLPPETRSMQARLFNDENTGFDVLVASDAIGMGLNLNIRRIIFHTTMKRGAKVANKKTNDDGTWLHPSFVKQIAGRAGRLSSNYKFGEVTAWQEHDLAYIRACLQIDVPQIPYCGIFPSVEQMEEFSEHVKLTNNGVPVTNLSALMSRFVEGARLDGRYLLSEHDDMMLLSNWLNTIPLSLQDRFTFANAPVNTRDQSIAHMIYQYAAQYALKRPVAINVRLSEKRPTNVLELNEVCMKHNILDLYIWLSLRFPEWFVEHDKCLEMKQQCIEFIEGALEKEDLGHKFCHAAEYRMIRSKDQRRHDEHPLPPVHFGDVRQIASNLMKNYKHDELFVFPHQKPMAEWSAVARPGRGRNDYGDRNRRFAGKRNDSDRSNPRGDAKQSSRDHSWTKDSYNNKRAGNNKWRENHSEHNSSPRGSSSKKNEDTHLFNSKEKVDPGKDIRTRPISRFDKCGESEDKKAISVAE